METSSEVIPSGPLLGQLDPNKASVSEMLSVLHSLETTLPSEGRSDPRLQSALISLVQQPVPLLSYAAQKAIQCVLNSGLIGGREAAAWMAALLDLPEGADCRTAVNALECCNAILTSWREERHPELLDAARVCDAGLSPEVVAGAVAAAWEAVPAVFTRELARAVRDGEELPVTWAVRLVRALSQQQQEAACEAAGGGVWEAVLASWPQLSGGMWEARRQVLMLALELLRQHLPSRTVHGLLQAMESMLMEELPAEAEKAEEVAVMCAFLRPTSAADLLPYRIALTCKALGCALSSPSEDGQEGERLLQLMLDSPLSRRYLRTAPDHSGLIESLSEQDDVLFEALNDWLVFVARAQQAGRGEGAGMLLAVQQGDAVSMLVCLVRSLGADEQVLLDMMLSSDDAGVLEYLIRVTKYVAWRLGGSSCEGSSSRPVLDEGVREAVLCLLQLGARVEVLCGKGLFPYDATPWLNRVAECRAAWQAAAKAEGLDSASEG